MNTIMQLRVAQFEGNCLTGRRLLDSGKRDFVKVTIPTVVDEI